MIASIVWHTAGVRVNKFHAHRRIGVTSRNFKSDNAHGEDKRGVVNDFTSVFGGDMVVLGVVE